MPGHQAGSYLKTLWGHHSKAALKAARSGGILLRAAEAASLQGALTEDARGYYFSGALTFVEGLRGPPAGLHTWATVKMYYAVFYALRAILALRGHCVFYIDGSPYTIEAQTGQSPAMGLQSTHKAVLQCFRDNCRSHALLSQQIDLTDPLKWLMDHREEANYKHARFHEPLVPPHFERVVRDGPRRSVSAYLEARNQGLVFDPDHAMIAFPLASLRHARDELRAAGIAPLDADGAAAIEPHCLDERGHRFDGLFRFLKG